MSRRATDWALILGIAICFLPLGAVFWADWIAGRHGCTLNEAGVHPCLVAGRDIGELLATAFVSGWFMLATLPVALVLAIVLVVRWVSRLVRRPKS